MGTLQEKLMAPAYADIWTIGTASSWWGATEPIAPAAASGCEGDILDQTPGQRPGGAFLDAAQVHCATTHRDELLARGSTPSRTVRVATDGDAPPPPYPLDVSIVSLPRAPSRPSGRRFGSLLHAILAATPMDADAQSLARVAMLQRRILGATKDEEAAALQAVKAALASPLLARARDAARCGACRCETPLSLLLGDTLVEGVVDLAFEDEDGTTVVDFKTDSDATPALEAYRKQVSLYACAIGEATGRPTRAVLLFI